MVASIDPCAWLSARARAANEAVDGKLTIVVAEQGIGDTARAIATCAGIYTAEPGTPVALVTQYDGTMAKRDMASHAAVCGCIADYIEAPTLIPEPHRRERMDRGALLDCLLPHCARLVDAMCVVPKVYARDGAEQARYDALLARHGAIYGGYPWFNWMLTYESAPWWVLARRTTGFPVDWADLALAACLDLAPWPEADEIPPGGSLAELQERSGAEDESLVGIQDGRPYVTIHTGAGGGGTNVKVLPKSIADAAIVRLESKGINCVQVGGRSDMPLPCFTRRLGLRLPLTNRVIHGAIAHIDNDSLLPCMANGLGIPSVVFFACTPHLTYGLPGNLNVPPGLNRKRTCPMRTCFWGGQWSPGENWHKTCRVGPYDAETRHLDPKKRVCLNFPEPKDAADVIEAFVMDRLQRKAKEAAA